MVAVQGMVTPEAIAAEGLLAEDRRDVGLLAVTSADRLHAGWTATCRAREERGEVGSRKPRGTPARPLPRHCALVGVIDGHPATLGWLGSVQGHRMRARGVEQFGQTGTLTDVYRHHRINTHAIVAATQSLAPGHPVRHARMM